MTGDILFLFYLDILFLIIYKIRKNSGEIIDDHGKRLDINSVLRIKIVKVEIEGNSMTALGTLDGEGLGNREID